MTFSAVNPAMYKDIEYDGVAAFWDPSAQMTLLFNSFVGGAAIFEYHSGRLEILRANDEYFLHVHTGNPADSYKALNILDYMTAESRSDFENMLKAASLHELELRAVISLEIIDDLAYLHYCSLSNSSISAKRSMSS